MPIQLNAILTPEAILDYLKKDILAFESTNPKAKRSKATQLDYLKKQLKTCFFETSTNLSDVDLVVLLSTDTRFNTYPYLRTALSAVFSLKTADDESVQNAIQQLERPPALDWDTAKFHAEFNKKNALYGYFTDTSKTQAYEQLFQKLTIACRTIAVFVEKNNTTDDDTAYDYAYKIMAIFIQPNQALPSFEAISKLTQDLLTKRDKKTDNPFYDVLGLKLKLPVASDIGDRSGWIALIKKQGEKVFPFFTYAKEIEIEDKISWEKKAPVTIIQAKQADVKRKYKRASDDLEFAMLCYQNDTGKVNDDLDMETTFNACLDYTKSGWPKKIGDSLPDLTIRGEGFTKNGKDIAKGYYWVKLPPSDKHALILGKITDCCQSMRGHSEACVKDAVSLSDNGLYVLLKHKRGDIDISKPKNDDGSINYENFQIIGQSYVWKSKSNGLCLDSIECLSNSIPNDVLKHTLSQFANQVLVNDPDINCVNIGRGGKTPNTLFPDTNYTQEIKQGEMYGDANSQYVMAQLPDLAISTHPELNRAWQKWQTENPLLNNRSLSFLAFLQALSPQQRLEALQAKDNNGRTLLQAAALNITAVSIPDILALYSDDAQRLEAINIKDARGQTVLHYAGNNLNAFNAIWAVFPDNNQRLEAAQVRDRDGKSVLNHATNNTAIFNILWNAFPNDTERFKAIYEPLYSSMENVPIRGKNRSVLRDAVQNTEVFNSILKIYPNNKLLLPAIAHPDNTGRCVLQDAVANTDVFMILWNLYPNDTERLKAFESINPQYGGLNLLQEAAIYPDVFKKIWSLYSDETQRLNALSVQNSIITSHSYSVNTVLSRALDEPKVLKVILDTLSSEGLMEAVKVRCGINGNDTLLHHAINKHPKELMVILERFSPEQLLTVLALKNASGQTVFNCLTKNPAVCMAIINKLPPNTLLEHIKTYASSDGETILSDAIGHPSLLISILEKLPPEQRLEAVELSTTDGDVILQKASSADEFIAIWNCYPDDDRRIELLNTETFGHATTLLRASYKPDYFAAVLNCLTIPQLTRVLVNNPNAFNFGHSEVNHLEICQACLQKKLMDTGSTSEDAITQLQQEIKQATRMDQLLNPAFLARIKQLSSKQHAKIDISLDKPLKIEKTINLDGICTDLLTAINLCEISSDDKIMEEFINSQRAGFQTAADTASKHRIILNLTQVLSDLAVGQQVVEYAKNLQTDTGYFQKGSKEKGEAILQAIKQVPISERGNIGKTDATPLVQEVQRAIATRRGYLRNTTPVASGVNTRASFIKIKKQLQNARNQSNAPEAENKEQSNPSITGLLHK